jgi:subtilisin family serine protease
MIIPTLLVWLAGLVCGLGGHGAIAYSLIELTPNATCTHAARLREEGATVVDAELAIYRLRDDAAERLGDELRRVGALTLIEPDRRIGRVSVLETDPLVSEEWWRAKVGIDGLTPPGPGKPVVIVDSGLELTHPEFAERPDTTALNPQTPEGLAGIHGTAVASVVGAPENGIGLIGIYPQAALRSWDTAPSGNEDLEVSEVIEGILAGARNAPAVINLSLGGDERDPLVERAVGIAVHAGALVVAAAGNDGSSGPLGYPATLPHVLTVAATDQAGRVASFSSTSKFVDLAAPGVAIPVAAAHTQGFMTASGTSFSTPLVAGAAAWVWTVRPELDAGQLFEVMRGSARDLGSPGWDPSSGYGMLDVAAALERRPPRRDPLEPNDDIEFVKSDGYFFAGVKPLTTRAKPSVNVLARLLRNEDPRDVYRVWLPARSSVSFALQATSDLDLSVWGARTISIFQAPGSDRLAVSARRGTGNERVSVRNEGGSGRVAYVAVRFGRVSPSADYTLSVKATPRAG